MKVNHIIMCVQCDTKTKYSNISNLRKHVTKFHPDNGDYLASLQLRKNKNYNFTCDKCHKRFNHRKHLRYHVKKIHGCLNEDTPYITDITKMNRCAMCTNFCADRKTIVEHYRQFHSISIEPENRTFQTEEEFITWKLTYENDTNSKYVINSRKCCKSHISTDFICHRSGRYIPQGKNIRLLKNKGSSKINALCPASIKVKKLNNGTCEVAIVDKHVGHENDIGHLNLSNTERQNLATKIASKIPFEDILDEIKHSITDDSELKRLHLLTKKDLYNIESSLLKSGTAGSESNLTAVKEESFEVEEHNLEAPSTTLKLETTSFASKKRRVASMLEELQHIVSCTTTDEELDVIEKALVPIKHTLTAVKPEAQ